MGWESAVLLFGLFWGEKGSALSAVGVQCAEGGPCFVDEALGSLIWWSSPACGRELELSDLLGPLPPKPFYESVICGTKVQQSILLCPQEDYPESLCQKLFQSS